MGKKSKLVLLYIRVGLSLACYSIFLILVLIKVIQNNDWPWAVVFIPVICFNAIAMFYYAIYLAGYIRDKLTTNYSSTRTDNTPCFPHQRSSIVPLIFYGLGVPLKLVIEVLVIIHLQGDTAIPFYAIGILLIIFFSILSVAMGYYSLEPTAIWFCDANC